MVFARQSLAIPPLRGSARLYNTSKQRKYCIFKRGLNMCQVWPWYGLRRIIYIVRHSHFLLLRV